MANKLKKIIENILVTIFAINFVIFGTWSFFVLLFVDTTQPLQEPDTLLSFYKLYFEIFSHLIKYAYNLF